MRRFTVTAFAVLYTAIIVFGSAQRTIDWAVKEADTAAHHDVHSSKAFQQGAKSVSRVLQTKLLEGNFVVELPKDATSPVAPLQRHKIRQNAGFNLFPFARRIPYRAPPFLL